MGEHDPNEPCEGVSGPCGHTPTMLVPCRTAYALPPPPEEVAKRMAQLEAETDPARRALLQEILVDYDRQIEEGDRNRSPVLCAECAKEYNEYWDEMWNSYYSGRL